MTVGNRLPGPRSLAAPLARVTRPILRRRGLAAAQIVARWRDIMGPQLASQSIPQRYTADRQGGGTLHIRVGGGWAPEFQHLQPQIIERINTFYGYRAVSRLVLVQGPVPQAENRAKADDAAADEADDDDAAAIVIDDDQLRHALQRLGRAVRRRHKVNKKS